MKWFGWLRGIGARVPTWLWVVMGIEALAIAAIAGSIIAFPEWLTAAETASVTIRNLGLLIVALVALPLAVWRSVVAGRQAKTAQQQAETAQQGLRNERYQKAAEMLGSGVLTVRLGGIYALRRLAEEHPKEYHLQIMRLFCVFVREPTAKNDKGTKQSETGIEPIIGNLHRDVEAVMEAIAARDESRVHIERDAKFQLDFRGAKLRYLNLNSFKFADLSGADFSFADLSYAQFGSHTNMSSVRAAGANFSGADFMEVNLSKARFSDSDFSDAHFFDGNLSDARFLNSDLSCAHFFDADLTGALFLSLGQNPPCKLTQAELDKACADPNRPPRFLDVVGADTGEPVVWRGEAKAPGGTE